MWLPPRSPGRLATGLLTAALAVGASTAAATPARGAVARGRVVHSQATGGSTAPVVRTDAGSVRGVAAGGIAAFRGIPFAAPPLGALRWAPPAPVTAWKGIRDASRFGNQCLQPNGGSEDCLYLNVHRPAGAPLRATAGRSLPVIVWIHGGSFISGAGSQYDPAPLVSRGAVVVTVNYRLGVLGSLALEALDAEDPAHGSGVYALQDQQAALRWVRRNIAAFGGDPNTVTVMGQSAGAEFACLHMVSPGSAGLVHRVAAQSGCSLSTVPLQVGQAVGQSVAEAVGCGATAGQLTCLRDAPASVLWAAAANAGGVGVFGSVPSVGGPLLPRTVTQALATGTAAPLPLLQGSSRYEGRIFVYGQDFGPTPTDATSYAGWLDRVLAGTGRDTQHVLAEYPLTRYSSAAEAASAVFGDSHFSCPALAVDRLAAARQPVYAYEFADPHAPALRPMPVAGATHTSELPYLMAYPTIPLSQAQRGLSGSMSRYWVAHARSGNPNAASDEAAWPRYTTSTGALAVLTPGLSGLRESAFAATHHCGFWPVP